MTDITPPLNDDQSAALRAIYRDAYGRGHRDGFKAGLAEKVWLHRNWPGIALVIGFVMLLVGILIGAQT